MILIMMLFMHADDACWCMVTMSIYEHGVYCAGKGLGAADASATAAATATATATAIAESIAKATNNNAAAVAAAKATDVQTAVAKAIATAQAAVISTGEAAMQQDCVLPARCGLHRTTLTTTQDSAACLSHVFMSFGSVRSPGSGDRHRQLQSIVTEHSMPAQALDGMAQADSVRCMKIATMLDVCACMREVCCCAGGTAQANTTAIATNVQNAVAQVLTKALAAVSGNKAAAGGVAASGPGAATGK
jgi:hypothetical protein